MMTGTVRQAEADLSDVWAAYRAGNSLFWSKALLRQFVRSNIAAVRAARKAQSNAWHASAVEQQEAA